MSCVELYNNYVSMSNETFIGKTNIHKLKWKRFAYNMIEMKLKYDNITWYSTSLSMLILNNFTLVASLKDIETSEYHIKSAITIGSCLLDNTAYYNDSSDVSDGVCDILKVLDGKVYIPSLLTYVYSIAELLEYKTDLYEKIAIIVMTDVDVFAYDFAKIATDIVYFAAMLEDSPMTELLHKYEYKRTTFLQKIYNICRDFFVYTIGTDNSLADLRKLILNKKIDIGGTLVERNIQKTVSIDYPDRISIPIIDKTVPKIATTLYSSIKVGTMNGKHLAIKKQDVNKYDQSVIKEIAIMRSVCNKSEYLVKCEAYYIDYFNSYIGMEMADTDLYHRLRDNKPITVENRRQWSKQLLLGLNTLHKHGILHADIKPNNILVYGDDIKIADFGISEIGYIHKDHRLLRPYCIVTLEYRPPELIMLDIISKDSKALAEYGFEVDIWSVGVVMLELELGYSPFYTGKQDKLKVLTMIERYLGRYEPYPVEFDDMLPKYILYNIDDTIRTIVLKMLSYNANERPSTDEVLTMMTW